MKKHYQILTILVLIIIFSMALLFMGCKETDLPIGMTEQDIKEEAEAAEEAALLEETRKKAEEYEAAKKAEEAAEEEKLIPNEPITYSNSEIDGALIILIVNFKTKEVKGSISKSGDDYIDATINGEIININTLEITTNYSGIEGSGDVEFQINGTITGIITEDLNTFNGIILPDWEDAEGVEFTATR